MIRKIREARENEEGFTLIELLVVVIIIGILAAIAIPVFLNQRERAWNSAVQSDLRNAAVEMESAMAETGSYPAAIPADFQATDGVNVAAPVISDGTVSPAGQVYCLSATHDNLSGTPVATYVSNTGGLDTSGTACPAASAL